MAKQRSSSGPPAIVVRKVPSDSDPGKSYEIRISRVDGRLYCTCKRWGFAKSCRHTETTTKEEILAALELACKTGVLGI